MKLTLITRLNEYFSKQQNLVNQEKIKDLDRKELYTLFLKKEITMEDCMIRQLLGEYGDWYDTDKERNGYKKTNKICK